MKTNTKTSIRKKILIAPAILLSVLFFNLSIGVGNDSFVKLFPVASACHKTYSLSGYEWTDVRASEEPCNTYCENEGYDKGTVTASGDKTCAGAECSYISNFTTGEQNKAGNDGHCGCNSQFTCACSNNEVKKPDIIVKYAYIEPEDPTTDDTVCLYATIKNIGTEDVELHDLTSWTHVNGFYAANTFYGENISVGEKITKEVFCSKYGDNVWFKKGENSVKVNIDPSAINIINESNENNNEKTISFTISASNSENDLIVSPGKSIFTATPVTVPADNYSVSNLKVIVKNENGDLLSNRVVTVSSDRGDQGSEYVNSVYTATTDSEGEAKFAVKSSVPGISTYTAIVDWNKRSGMGYQGMTLTQKVRVIFSAKAVCGNGICEDGETLENCAKDCNVIYPSESNVDYCINNTGKRYPTTGEGSATWFLWNGCSKYKVYNVKPNEQIDMKITGDSCSDCVCYSPSFVIYEYNDQTGAWIKTKEYVEPGYKGYSDNLLYTPKFSKIKVVASRCFYLRIYGETVEDENDWDNSDTCLPDGTLIKLPNDPRIFVIKNCKKQWIRTAEEFKNSGYKWSDVNDASKEVVDAYADYLEATAKLLRVTGHDKIYRIINGKILWVPTVSAFNAQGLKWEDVQDNDETAINKYPRIKLIKGEGDDRIFYITNSGMKKHLINTEVFNSYDENKNFEVVKVSPIVINSLRTVNLFKDKDGNKVYKIEGNKKKWIKTSEAFKKHNFDWNKITPVNETELSAYKDDGIIE